VVHPELSYFLTNRNTRDKIAQVVSLVKGRCRSLPHPLTCASVRRWSSTISAVRLSRCAASPAAATVEAFRSSCTSASIRAEDSLASAAARARLLLRRSNSAARCSRSARDCSTSFSACRSLASDNSPCTLYLQTPKWMQQPSISRPAHSMRSCLRCAHPRTRPGQKKTSATYWSDPR
jgi:hypothetical protein